MSLPADQERLVALDFDAFRELALRDEISEHERVGFPAAYREGRESAILEDIAAKLPALREGYDGPGATVIDIGCGCGPLAEAIQRRCASAGHELVLVDSAEMLARNLDAARLVKVAGRFPDCDASLARWRGGAVAVLVYSVIQYAFPSPGVFGFVDAACKLLAPGGRLLVGDIPNASMRRRFLASDTGADYHRHYTGGHASPSVSFNAPVGDEPDDAVTFALASRARAAGLHAWIVPQDPSLPMANRREDLLIERP